MRVLHLVHSLGCGGLERVVVSLANGLTRRGLPQAVCCLHEVGPLARKLDPDVRTFFLGAEPNDWALPFKLRDVYRTFQPDVIDSADFASWPEATLAGLTRPGIRRARAFHGFLSRPPRRWQLAGHLLARWTHQLRAVSVELARKVAEVYRIPLGRIEVMPNGVDTDHFDRIACPERGPGTPQRFTCVTVASLTPAKNPLGLIEVARRVGSGVHFVWVGDGPLRDEFVRRLSECGMAESFTLTGRLEDVRSELAGADAFVLPSVTEAAPVCVLEAMSMQLPVIATRTGDLEQMIRPGRSGFLVDPGDTAGLAAAIERLGADPALRRTMGANGRATVMERFSLGRMLDRYQEGYERLCRERGAPRSALVVSAS
jgi:glycosyltransferase involved in cell wall biosynthesis